MNDLRDPNKNFEVMWRMTQQGQNYSAWALPNADGTLTGWAANLSPAQQQRFENAFNQKLAEFPRFAAQAGIPGFENGNA
jgi:ABC-type transporter MlaC component